MERKKVLIVTSSIDETATYVMEKYHDRATFFRVNVDEFGQYDFKIGNKGWGISKGILKITSNDTYSIYYRKPMLPDLTEYEPQYHLMIKRDIISVINGIVDSFYGKVLTKPCVLRKVENKVYQLIYASEKGWKIPGSYIGNSINECSKYEKDLSIIKPLTTGKVYSKTGCEIYQTQLFSGAYEDVNNTPVYLQKYVEKSYEVRVTIIGNSVYSVRIDTKNKIDWRADYHNHKYTCIVCPSEIVQKCYQMMNDYSLNFGAFDFIVTHEGEWIFLEVNPNGQWLWLEKALDLDVSGKIVEYLID